MILDMSQAGKLFIYYTDKADKAEAQTYRVLFLPNMNKSTDKRIIFVLTFTGHRCNMGSRNIII